MEDDDFIVVLFVAVAAYFFFRSRSTAVASGGYYSPSPSVNSYYPPPYDGSGNAIVYNPPMTALSSLLSDEMNASFTNDPSMSQSGNPMSMTLSDAGAAFIKQQEGFAASPYVDGNGYSGGYGHHFQPGESIPPLISYDQANVWFANDVATAISAIQSSVYVPLTQGQFDALVDFIFNEGVGAFKSSTLLAMLNTGDTMGAGQQFSRWDISGGQVNHVLEARRSGDQQMWTA